MRKLLSLVIVVLFLMVGCAALQVGQSQLETYTFNYDGHEYSALLPKGVPLPLESAIMRPAWFPGWGSLTVMHVSYSAIQKYPIVSFWFTKDFGVVALVFHTGDEHIPYLYKEGLAVKVSGEEIDALLDGIARNK